MRTWVLNLEQEVIPPDYYWAFLCHKLSCDVGNFYSWASADEIRNRKSLCQQTAYFKNFAGSQDLKNRGYKLHRFFSPPPTL